MEIMIVLGLALVIVAAFAISLYNKLIRLRNAKDTAWGQVDVQLQLRLDLIPALVETVRGYAQHESETLTQVTEARSKAFSAKSPAESEKIETGLSGALARLLALSESYPDLKANTLFGDLQSQLASIESNINFARRFYNESVNIYNTSVQSFPAVLFSATLGFQAAQLFLAKVEAQEPPKFKFGGNHG